MAFQTSVNQKLAVGVIGDFYDNSPRIVDPKTVVSADAGSIGCAYTIDATDPSKVVLGGEGVFAGIAVNSKELVRNGLGATLALRQYEEIEVCSMGRVWLSIEDTVSVGMAAYFDKATGAISAAAAGQEIEGKTEIKGSKFVEVKGTADEPMVVLQLG